MIKIRNTREIQEKLLVNQKQVNIYIIYMIKRKIHTHNIIIVEIYAKTKLY